MNMTNSIEKQMELEAPVSRVWRALTDYREFGEWFRVKLDGPFAAGLRFLPITMLSFVVAPVAGKLSVRIKARYLLGSGLLLVAIGLLLMSMVHAQSGWTVLLPGFIVTGIVKLRVFGS